MRQLLVLLALTTVFACTPHPTPDPNYPVIGDAAPPVDAAPADCSAFAGRWKAVDTVTMVDGSCTPGAMNDLLTLSATSLPEEQANEGWRGVITTHEGFMMTGPVSRVDARPWTCHFVVETSDAPDGDIYARDFIMGEVDGKGRGEATGRSGECVWKTATYLERF